MFCREIGPLRLLISSKTCLPVGLCQQVAVCTFNQVAATDTADHTSESRWEENTLVDKNTCNSSLGIIVS